MLFHPSSALPRPSLRSSQSLLLLHWNLILSSMHAFSDPTSHITNPHPSHPFLLFSSVFSSVFVLFHQLPLRRLTTPLLPCVSSSPLSLSHHPRSSVPRLELHNDFLSLSVSPYFSLYTMSCRLFLFSLTYLPYLSERDFWAACSCSCSFSDMRRSTAGPLFGYILDTRLSTSLHLTPPHYVPGRLGRYTSHDQVLVGLSCLSVCR